MADAVVEFLLENIKQLLVYNVDLISEVKEEVESLHWDLHLMNAFLKDANVNRSQNEVGRQIVRQITDFTYKAEDIIDEYVVTAAKYRTRNRLSRIFHVLDSRSTAKDIDSLSKKFKRLHDTWISRQVPQVGEPSTTPSPQRRTYVAEEDNVVGFDDEAKTVIDRLTTGKKQLEVISIVGMGGLGKTTLARKIYTNRSIKDHFSIRAWVRVSQDYSRKEVFLATLDSLKQLTAEMQNFCEEVLGEIIYEYLHKGTYLIVTDDVWKTETWNDLKVAFPNRNCGSRILLTSRNTNVAVRANRVNPPHHLRFLNDDESWELLQKKVFDTENCPSELKDPGKEISVKCYGLPLAVMAVADVLSKRDKTSDFWKRVASSLGTYVARDAKIWLDVLALSYSHLPDHLKNCFIYFGVFPEKFVIRVWKLLRLWVAEGFIQQRGQECFEDVAEEYLEDLIARNLIIVEEKRANGRVKTCRIHYMLRELCSREGEEKKSLTVIGPKFPNEYHRRLCVHSNVRAYAFSRPSNPRVRSFMCFAIQETNLPKEHTSFIHKAFKLVRVLDVKTIYLYTFPRGIVRLVHLRYVAIFGNFKVIPDFISKLWNLQTLIVKTTAGEIDVQVDIWKMVHFRHLHTSASSHLHGPPPKTRKYNEDSFVWSDMQTISTISPYSCTENILARTPNLRKLGIRGKLIALVEEKVGSSMFDNFAILGNLETLKLLNDTSPLANLQQLPEWYKFPPNLKKITFSKTWLDWKQMLTIGMLPNLEILKLLENAFMGHHWEPLDEGFRLLKVLHLDTTDLVQWDASSHHFPKLERIVLKNCDKLGAIPSGLGSVSALKTMELHSPTPSIANSAREIQQQLSRVNNEFKLLVYPTGC